ncbi:MAG TPA: nuclear transport factor 2 family protein [Longimicrobiales bacterium]|nr:nuclear transport factor 2 family protein [Longimicrobiales bacterium]
MKVRLSLLAVTLFGAAPLFAQDHSHDARSVPRAEARLSGDEEAVLVPVDMLFDGMRARDTAMIRAAFTENGGLTGPAQGQDGSWSVRSTPVDEFVATIARLDRVIDEPLFDVEVRVDGPLATVWAEYDVYVDGDFSHCGVDAFQLADLGDGWRIMTIADTRRREGCERVRADN